MKALSKSSLTSDKGGEYLEKPLSCSGLIMENYDAELEFL